MYGRENATIVEDAQVCSAKEAEDAFARHPSSLVRACVAYTTLRRSTFVLARLCQTLVRA